MKVDISDLKKLSRKELLELLIDQVKENENLQRELDEAKTELQRRDLIMKNAGSMAEAALEIFDIFKKADQAAKLYLDNVKNLANQDGDVNEW